MQTFVNVKLVSNVDLPTITRYSVDKLGVFLLWKFVFASGQNGMECLPRLEDHSAVVLTAYTPDVVAHS